MSGFDKTNQVSAPAGFGAPTRNKTNKAYSLDDKSWSSIGNELKMNYSLPHFMGYRFGLFNYATRETGGYADFDYFRISEGITGR